MKKIISLTAILLLSISCASKSKIERINPETLLDTSKYGFTQVVTARGGKTVYISGQFSGDTKGKVRGKTAEEQIEFTFENLRKAIEASGGKPEHVVKITVLVKDHNEKKVVKLGQEIDKLFGDNLPASTLIPVPRLALDEMLFEIDATLVIPE